MVDEAHVLSVDLLEEIRLLSNNDILGQNVLSIFLVGQPELNERMSDDRLLPLRQRIRIRFHLKPFTREETLQYILHRMRKSGANHLNIFSDEAVSLIYSVSKGTPRLINILCDHALLLGFSENKPEIGPGTIRECVKDLHFPGEGNQLPVRKSDDKNWPRKLLYLLVLLVPLLAIFFLIKQNHISLNSILLFVGLD